MIGNAVRPRDLADLLHLEQRDRLDRRAGQAALDVADHRLARCAASMAMPIIVLMTASASLPASMQRRAFSRMSVWFGDSLVISGLLRDLAAGRDHARGHLRLVAELHAAFLHVRAGDVDLDGIDG